MKGFLIFALLLLLITPAFAETKGNPDILKRNIIEACEGIDEFGNCITNEETEPVTEKLTKTVTRMASSTAVNLGLPDSTDMTVVIILGIIVVAIVIFVLREASR